MKDFAPLCPDAEVLAAFIAGTLPPAELERVSAHLVGCPECRGIVGEAARFEREEVGTKPAGAGLPMGWWIAAAAAIAIGLLALIPWAISRSRRSPIEDLAAAAPTSGRLLEARLSGFAWAPVERVTRGASDDPARTRMEAEARRLVDRTAGLRTPFARHVAGVASLVAGRPADAIPALTAAASASNDPVTWSDLAAAHYTAAIYDGSPDHLHDALAAADRALAINPQLAEALFNRALTLERLGRASEAKAAWTTYLAVDNSSGWAKEARAHLSR